MLAAMLRQASDMLDCHAASAALGMSIGTMLKAASRSRAQCCVSSHVDDWAGVFDLKAGKDVEVLLHVCAHLLTDTHAPHMLDEL